MKFLSVLLITTVLTSSVLACSEDGGNGFLPENDLYIPVGTRLNGLTQNQFNAVIDKIEDIYEPIISNLGGRLTISRGWSDGTVNAFATRSGNKWSVSMFGGLARHPAITEDGFSLVLCHELGHHVGGAPKIFDGEINWASNEGQADYFATLKCLRRVWVNDNNIEIVRNLKAPAALTVACNKAWPNAVDNAICVRNGMAGASVAGLFAALDNKPDAQFDTPDTNVVTRTDDAHPATQCRLDTYFQGALCEKTFNEDVSNASEVTGTCHASTGQSVGLRPLCWFKPSDKYL